MQLTFDFFDDFHTPLSSDIAEAVETLARQGGVDIRGAIFTRAEVVEFILDLAGYVTDQPLHRMRILEPSFGAGDFLLPIVDRLLAAWRSAKPAESVVGALGNAVRAVELHRETFTVTRRTVIEWLIKSGIEDQSAIALADQWLLQGDFLLAAIDGEFDFAVGNPPYVRQELIPAPLLAAYRERYSTLYDRADLYIPFIERSLRLLTPNGCLGFICADRWMKNRYGGPLRRLIAEHFSLKVYVDMMDTAAFHSEVSAYPAITIISRQKTDVTRIAHAPSLDRSNLNVLAAELRSKRLPQKGTAVRELACVTNGDEPWLLDASTQMALIRRLEQHLPTLEEAGCKVGIGVATGADQAFIGDFAALDVEADRKLPLVMTDDIVSGEVVWRGQGVINPFAEDGQLVDLHMYPRLRCYLEARRDVIAARHCAQKVPSKWYRTIDRIDPALTGMPKLLIPDIKGEAHVVFEPGKFYPHHNLYYVISKEWDLRALQAVLLSDIARLFIATYSTKMRGGYLRFQAQYLRRIRIPLWQHVSDDLRNSLIVAAISRDIDACNCAVFELYKLSQEERLTLGATQDRDAS